MPRARLCNLIDHASAYSWIKIDPKSRKISTEPTENVSAPALKNFRPHAQGLNLGLNLAPRYSSNDRVTVFIPDIEEQSCNLEKFDPLSLLEISADRTAVIRCSHVIVFCLFLCPLDITGGREGRKEGRKEGGRAYRAFFLSSPPLNRQTERGPRARPSSLTRSLFVSRELWS